VIAAVIIGTRRWLARGGARDTVETVALVAVPFGIVGARIYHVITDYQLYFGPGREPIRALYIWQGGLGIWGGVALGAVGAYLVARRRKVRFWALGDALAPGLLVAQAIGRLGNYFNQELYGRPTTVPWAVQIDPEHRVPGYEQYATFHPTFLYELIWNLLSAAVLVFLDRRYQLGHGKVFTLYVMFYTAGRTWIEWLRIDAANHIGEFRINNYVSVLVFLAASLVFVFLHLKRPGREEIVEGDVRLVNGLPPEEAAAGTQQVAPSDAADGQRTAGSGGAEPDDAGPDGDSGPDRDVDPGPDGPKPDESDREDADAGDGDPARSD
jgi:prolipoprotein diacylglyceryl transferase